MGGVSEDGRSFLSQLESLLSRDALPQTDRIPLPPDLLLEYLNEMVCPCGKCIRIERKKLIVNREKNFRKSKFSPILLYTVTS